MLLSIGMNIKLSKSIGIFNLPPEITCPGQTELCKAICYAKKANRLYTNARNNRIHNLECSRSIGFINAILEEIDAESLVLVRIHESGDFYSQAYLNKWIRIAQLRPAVRFLAYTKSYMLTFARAPKNMVIFGSVDATTDFARFHLPKRLLSRILEPEEEYAGYYICPPVSKTHKHYCGSECMHCWEAKGNVAWIKH